MDGIQKYPSIWIGAFFAAYLLLGLYLLQDYGISFDEPIQRVHGIVTADYLNEYFGWYEDKLEPEHDYRTYEHRYYGVLFTTICFGLERWLGLDDFREQHLLRHYGVFLIACLGYWCFFLLLRRYFQDWRWAMVGTLFLMLSPRTFAHQFYNVKDAIFMAAYGMAAYGLVRFLQDRTVNSALIFALTTAFAINVRIVGLIIPAIALAWMVPTFWNNWSDAKRRLQLSLALGVYLVAMVGLTILGWPYLWEAPWAHLLEAFDAMGKYDWQGTIRLWNRDYQAQDLPWYYLPSWMLITIPILYWVLFWRGFGPALARLAKWIFTWKMTAFREDRALIESVLVSLFLLPVLVVIIGQSTLYDGWRQMFFVYPPFIALATIGLCWAIQRQKKPARQSVIWALVGVGVLNIVWSMVRFHPNQQVYFNWLAGAEIHYRHETDYWGLSYKQGLEALLEYDPGDSISFYVPNYPGTANREFLPNVLEDRLEQRWQMEAGATYYLTNFRSTIERNRYKKRTPPFDKELILIRAGDIPILGVFQLNEK